MTFVYLNSYIIDYLNIAGAVLCRGSGGTQCKGENHGSVNYQRVEGRP